MNVLPLWKWRVDLLQVSAGEAGDVCDFHEEEAGPSLDSPLSGVLSWVMSEQRIKNLTLLLDSLYTVSYCLLPGFSIVLITSGLESSLAHWQFKFCAYWSLELGLGVWQTLNWITIAEEIQHVHDVDLRKANHKLVLGGILIVKRSSIIWNITSLELNGMQLDSDVTLFAVNNNHHVRISQSQSNLNSWAASH